MKLVLRHMLHSMQFFLLCLYLQQMYYEIITSLANIFFSDISSEEGHACLLFTISFFLLSFSSHLLQKGDRRIIFPLGLDTTKAPAKSIFGVKWVSRGSFICTVRTHLIEEWMWSSWPVRGVRLPLLSGRRAVTNIPLLNNGRQENTTFFVFLRFSRTIRSSKILWPNIVSCRQWSEAKYKNDTNKSSCPERECLLCLLSFFFFVFCYFFFSVFFHYFLRLL